MIRSQFDGRTTCLHEDSRHGQLRHFISADLFDYFSRILELSHTTAHR